jgi:hypothetical protein
MVAKKNTRIYISKKLGMSLCPFFAENDVNWFIAVNILPD